MPTRFALDVWNNSPWFRELESVAKLLMEYWNMNCDCAGFWRLDVQDAAFRINVAPTAIQTALTGNPRLYIEHDDTFWFPWFLEHQKNLPLSPKTDNAHLGIVRRIAKHPKFHTDIANALGIRNIDMLLEGAAKPLGRGTRKRKRICKRILVEENKVDLVKAYMGSDDANERCIAQMFKVYKSDRVCPKAIISFEKFIKHIEACLANEWGFDHIQQKLLKWRQDREHSRAAMIYTILAEEKKKVNPDYVRGKKPEGYVGLALSKLQNSEEPVAISTFLQNKFNLNKRDADMTVMEAGTMLERS